MVTTVEGLLWGLDELPAEAGSGHFLVAGASGSGKTVLIERLLWSLFCNPASRLHPFQRAALYDPKQELISKLYSGLLRRDPQSDPYKRIQILHPFDTRSTSWKMAFDIATPIHARQLAQTLVPEHPGRKSSFFDDAVRDLLTGVLQSLIFCAPKAASWRFRDVILGVLYEPYLRFLLGRRTDRDGSPFTLGARLSASYLEGDPKMMMSLRASLSTAPQNRGLEFMPP